VPRPKASAWSWRRSSRCDTNTCLEITTANGLLWLRNSNQPELVVSFTAGEWESFREALIHGEFDDLDQVADGGS
jgi:hypothetical protein